MIRNCKRNEYKVFVCLTHSRQMMQAKIQEKWSLIRLFHWINSISCVFFDALMEFIGFPDARELLIAIALLLLVNISKQQANGRRHVMIIVLRGLTLCHETLLTIDTNKFTHSKVFQDLTTLLFAQ